jgi:IS1 family transposase
MVKKKANLEPAIEDTLQPAKHEDVLELDEVWSFVHQRTNKRWLWIALCRRTRQVVAYFIGDRSELSCKALWEQIPENYRKLHTYSDFWNAYKKVFPEETHRSVGKESGETNHVERWNNTLRQWVSRYTRKTLSFSKSDEFHNLVTHLFIRKYNLNLLFRS